MSIQLLPKTYAASGFDVEGMADTLLIPPDAYESAKERGVIESLSKGMSGRKPTGYR